MLRSILASVILTSTIVGCRSAVQNDSEGKIIGGEDVATRFPFMAEIGSDNADGRRMFCGGSLIGSNIVLTAAHCVYNEVKKIHVSVGKTVSMGEADARMRMYPVAAIISHPAYDPMTQENDIAILVLEGASFKEENWLAYGDFPINASAPMKVIGWGNTSSFGSLFETKLRAADLDYVTKNVCTGGYGDMLMPGMFCAGEIAGGKDSCQGDSGGPVVQMNNNNQYLLKGVVSWGFGCAQPGYPGVYTDVHYFNDWIKTTVANLSDFWKKDQLNKDIVRQFCYNKSMLRQNYIDREDAFLTFNTVMNFDQPIEQPKGITQWRKFCEFTVPHTENHFTVEHSGNYGKVSNRADGKVWYFDLVKNRSIDLHCRLQQDNSDVQLEVGQDGKGWLWMDDEWLYVSPVESTFNDLVFHGTKSLRSCEIKSRAGKVKVQTTYSPSKTAGFIKVSSDFTTRFYQFDFWEQDTTPLVYIQIMHFPTAQPLLSVINNDYNTIYNWTMECNSEFSLSQDGKAIPFSEEMIQTEDEEGKITDVKLRKFRFLWPNDSNATIKTDGAASFNYAGPSLTGTHTDVCTINGESVPVRYVRSSKE